MADAPSFQDIFQWEVCSWSRALTIWSKHLPTHRPATALGIGEREGGLSLWLAAEGIDVTCTDLRPFPAETKVLHQKYGVESRIRYQQADVTCLPFMEGSYDIVYFKSVIGALESKEKQVEAIREMHRVLRPGGVLLFAENLQGTAVHGWLRKRYVSWSSYWRYLDHNTDRDLFSPFATLHDATTGLLANLGRSEGQRDLLARVDGVLAPLVPRSQRTIWYGAAIKG